ncbi:hypothetical protein Aduo_015183 [Ancylostoma duodenale]
MKLLKSWSTAIVSLDDERRGEEISPKRILYPNITTCHRNIVKKKFFCYTVDVKNRVISEREMEVSKRAIVPAKKTKDMLLDYINENIASYSTLEGENHIWVPSPLNWVYTININELKGAGVPKAIYHLSDNGNVRGGEIRIIYADAGGLVTRQCYKENQCLYEYNIPVQIFALFHGKQTIKACA